jgi:hypothetical protein
VSKPILGAAEPAQATSDFNLISFIASMVMGAAATATLVKIIAVNGQTVNVNPLVGQVDGSGNVTPHGVVNNLPFICFQGGSSAVNITPSVGDIGLAIFCDHDISSVKASKGAAPPGSLRRFDMADGVYITALPGLNAAATQTITFVPAGGGINIVTSGPLAIMASTVTHNGTDIGAAHRHPYIPGSGAETDTGTPV